jgi:hypothetical protein
MMSSGATTPTTRTTRTIAAAGGGGSGGGGVKDSERTPAQLLPTCGAQGDKPACRSGSAAKRACRGATIRGAPSTTTAAAAAATTATAAGAAAGVPPLVMVCSGLSDAEVDAVHTLAAASGRSGV